MYRNHALVALLMWGIGCSECDENQDSDGDGLDDCVELAAGLDPERSDSDGDGEGDGTEVDCGSDPLDDGQVCYACGWTRGDSSGFVSTGKETGDVISNLTFFDQCEEQVSLWDFAEEYHILWMTASW